MLAMVNKGGFKIAYSFWSNKNILILIAFQMSLVFLIIGLFD